MSVADVRRRRRLRRVLRVVRQEGGGGARADRVAGRPAERGQPRPAGLLGARRAPHHRERAQLDRPRAARLGHADHLRHDPRRQVAPAAAVRRRSRARRRATRAPHGAGQQRAVRDARPDRRVAPGDDDGGRPGGRAAETPRPVARWPTAWTSRWTSRARSRSPAAEEQGLFRIAQEALNNVAKHAGGRAGDRPPAAARAFPDGDPRPRAGASTRATRAGGTGIGLGSMRERAAEIGWTLEIVAAPGEGTVVRLQRDAETTRRAP